MQACPYDALYIDPQTETAAKCNFCAHKVEVGLEPPCVTVCPTQAIVAGDLDNPASRASPPSWAASPSQVRKPEKGTRPKLFYIQGDADSLVPVGRAAALGLHVGPGTAACRAAGAAPDRRRRGARGAPTGCASSTATPGDGRSRSTSGPSRWPRARSWCRRSCRCSIRSAGVARCGRGSRSLASVFLGLTGLLLDRRPAAAAAVPLDAHEAAMAVAGWCAGRT